MGATVNIQPTPMADGIVYASGVPVLSSEASLGDGLKTPDPIAVIEGQEIVAIVKLTFNGNSTTGSTYIVLQTDLGDGTWIDVAWLFTNLTQGSFTGVLTAGGRGAMANAFQQSRNKGQVPQPQANGQNQCPLGGRVRIVGQASFSGQSSSAGGNPTSPCTATITYKLSTPR